MALCSGGLKMVRIDFTKTDGIYTLQDALYLPDDNQLSDSEIEALKQERFDNWVAVLLTPVISNDSTTPTMEI